jgi:hypothetical protein
MSPDRRPLPRRARLAAALLLALPLGAGCQGGGAAEAPSTQAARRALDAALEAWKRGEKPGELPGTEPKVIAHDTPWAQGQRLASYEILGEGEDGRAAAEQQFNVRLSLAGPDRTEEVRYHVLGTGPLMVFREEDYQRNINMENGPSVTKSRKPGRRSK